MRIIDPNTNRDVLTGEEVSPPSAVVTPTAATPPEIAAAGVVPAPVVAADEVEATVKEIAPVFSETKEMAPSPTGVSTTNPNHPSNAPRAFALPFLGLNVSIIFRFYNNGWIANEFFFLFFMLQLPFIIGNKKIQQVSF